MPDPGAAWTVAYETTLSEEEPEDFPLSRSAKLSVFYAADRIASVVAVGSGRQ